MRRLDLGLSLVRLTDRPLPSEPGVPPRLTERLRLDRLTDEGVVGADPLVRDEDRPRLLKVDDRTRLDDRPLVGVDRGVDEDALVEGFRMGLLVVPS